MELVAGIHSVDGSRGAHCYLVPEEGGFCLVDSGMPGSAKAIVSYLKGIGRQEKDLRRIVLTHADLDHVGGAAEIKRRTGVPVSIHEADAPALKGEAERKRMKGVLGVLMRVMTRLVKVETMTPDQVLREGDMVGSLRVVAAPGHTPGSICLLHAPSGTLLAGDALRTSRDGRPVISPDLMNSDPAGARQSARKIAGLSFDAMLPGHGAPLLKAADEQVRDMVRVLPA